MAALFLCILNIIYILRMIARYAGRLFHIVAALFLCILKYYLYFENDCQICQEALPHYGCTLPLYPKILMFGSKYNKIILPIYSFCGKKIFLAHQTLRGLIPTRYFIRYIKNLFFFKRFQTTLILRSISKNSVLWIRIDRIRILKIWSCGSGSFADPDPLQIRILDNKKKSPNFQNIFILFL